MGTSHFTDDENRYALSNELHARPFPDVDGAGRAICIALLSPDSSEATRDAETRHLLDLLDRHGAPHPAQGANHYYGKVGRYMVKWERHTEFLTYTIFSTTPGDPPFSGDIDILSPDWCAAAPGKVITASQVNITVDDLIDSDDKDRLDMMSRWFESESLAVARVLDDNALIASDFRIDGNGYVRFAVVADKTTGSRRLGRIIQRLFEIETYKSMAMLSLPAARNVSAELSSIVPQLGTVVSNFANKSGSHEDDLDQLLDISARLENLTAQNASRFSAAEAYSAIVNQRIKVLRERRVSGRQIFSEFMMRRFEPAIRTCASTAARLEALTGQAARAGDMLRTQTDVTREEQNQAILSRMDERAGQQLRLQKTVEGLSVVAVSYYAVNLASYLLAPVSAPLGISKAALTALITIPVVLVVWAMIRKIRNHI